MDHASLTHSPIHPPTHHPPTTHPPTLSLSTPVCVLCARGSQYLFSLAEEHLPTGFRHFLVDIIVHVQCGVFGGWSSKNTKSIEYPKHFFQVHLLKYQFTKWSQIQREMRGVSDTGPTGPCPTYLLDAVKHWLRKRTDRWHRRGLGITDCVQVKLLKERVRF